METVKTVIVGLGNPILTDDGAGPAVARLVHQKLGDANVHLREASVGGIELVELLVGYKRAILIDAIKTEGGHLGDCYLLDITQSKPSKRTGINHQVGLLEGLELGRRMGMNMPDRLHIYAVEVADPFTFGTEMSPQVAAAVPLIAQKILVDEFGHKADSSYTICRL